MEKPLEDIRLHIDRIDTIIMNALAERMSLMVEIARIKKDHHLPAVSEKRDKEIMEKVNQIAKQYNVDQSFATEIYESIINESKRIISQEMKGKK